MNTQAKHEIIKLLSFDSMIKDYLKQPHKKTNFGGISNIRRREKNNKHLLTSNLKTLDEDTKTEQKRTCSTNNFNHKTISNVFSTKMLDNKKSKSHNTKAKNQARSMRVLDACKRINIEEKQQKKTTNKIIKNYSNFTILTQQHFEKKEGNSNLIRFPQSKQPQTNKNMKILKSQDIMCQGQCAKSTHAEDQSLRQHTEQSQMEEENKLKSFNILSKPKIEKNQKCLKRKKQVILKDRYRLQKIIGRGLSGVVYKARDILSERYIAIKVIESNNIEYEHLKQLDHPNLISYYNSFLQKKGKKEIRYLVLEYFPMNLSEVLRKYGKLEDKKLKNTFKAICSGVMYLHSLSFAHRDIKLQNIVCSQDLSIVKFIDFGLCLDICGMDAKESKRFCGTTPYMAPEVITGQCEEPKKADIWSLGIALYALAVGRPPFKGRQEEETFHKIKKNKTIFPPWMQEGLKDLLGRMLLKNANERPTIYEVVHDKWLQ